MVHVDGCAADDFVSVRAEASVEGVLPAEPSTDERMERMVRMLLLLLLASFVGIMTCHDAVVLPIHLLRLPLSVCLPVSVCVLFRMMQVAFVLYHYYNADEVFAPIRCFVSGYVWLTGFGKTCD